MSINGIGGAGMNGVTGMGLPSAAGLTPEGLMIYLQSRLQGLDSQVNSIFQKQQKDQKIQQAIHDIQAALSSAQGTSKSAKKGGPAADLQKAMQELKDADPQVAAQVEADLSKKGQVLEGSGFDADKYVKQQVENTEKNFSWWLPPDARKKILAQVKKKAIADAPKAAEKAAEKAKFTKDEVDKSQKYLDNLSGDLGQSAQLDMIHLQSLMSNRQTAVQLSTNLIQSLSHSADAIAANTGK